MTSTFILLTLDGPAITAVDDGDGLPSSNLSKRIAILAPFASGYSVFL